MRHAPQNRTPIRTPASTQRRAAVIHIIGLSLDDQLTDEQLVARIVLDAQGNRLLVQAALARVARAWLRSPTPLALRALSVLDLALTHLADGDDDAL